MKKYSIVLLSILLAYTVSAQHLQNGVPENAYAVATVNSKNFFDLISISEFNESKMGKALLGKATKNSNGEYKTVEDFGIDLHRQVYVYSTKTDSIVYFGMVVPLLDAQKLSALLREVDRPSFSENGLHRIDMKDKKQIVMWNDRNLYLLSGNLQESFFDKEETASKYGIKNTKLSDTYNAPLDTTAPLAIDTLNSYWNETDTVAESRSPTDSINQSSIYDDYYASIAQDDSIKNGLLKIWLNKEVNRLSEIKETFKNKSFKDATNKKALASVWIRNIDELYSDFVPKIYSSPLGKEANKFYAGFGSAQAHLVINQYNIKINGALEVAQDQAKTYRKIYHRKMNKKFFKYIDKDALAYMGYAINTQAYLEGLPGLMKQYYGGLFSGFKEEIDLGSSIFSLLLDEKAIGEVVKGDGLFVLNNVKEQEVKYTTYEYDDEYNSIEVEKTKKESLPDFLSMFSSDDTKVIEKLLSVGLSKHVLTEEKGIYTFRNKKSPFELHILLKDGIVFIGSSFNDLLNIQQGKTKNNLSAKNKKILMKNSMTLLMNTNQLTKAVNALDLPFSYQVKSLQDKFQGMGDFYFTSKGMKGNKMIGEFTAEFPSSHKNGLKYILYLIENTGVGGM